LLQTSRVSGTTSSPIGLSQKSMLRYAARRRSANSSSSVSTRTSTCAPRGSGKVNSTLPPSPTSTVNLYALCSIASLLSQRRPDAPWGELLLAHVAVLALRLLPARHGQDL